MVIGKRYDEDPAGMADAQGLHPLHEAVLVGRGAGRSAGGAQSTPEGGWDKARERMCLALLKHSADINCTTNPQGA